MPRQVVTRPITVTASTLKTRVLPSGEVEGTYGEPDEQPLEAAEAALAEVAAAAAAAQEAPPPPAPGAPTAAPAAPTAAPEPAAAAAAATAQPAPRRRRRNVQEMSLGGAAASAGPGPVEASGAEVTIADERPLEVPGSRLPHEVKWRVAGAAAGLRVRAEAVGLLTMGAFAAGLSVEAYADRMGFAVAVLRELRQVAVSPAPSTEPPAG